LADVIGIRRAAKCGLLQAKLRLLKKPKPRSSRPKKIAPAMNVFLTWDITDKLEPNTDRLNNKRYGAPKKN
jgi:hypothetical protein